MATPGWWRCGGERWFENRGQVPSPPQASKCRSGGFDRHRIGTADESLIAIVGPVAGKRKGSRRDAGDIDDRDAFARQRPPGPPRLVTRI